MNDKRIKCIRGGTQFPAVYPNGDRLDSCIHVYKGNDIWFTAPQVNTDPSLNAKYYGILAEGVYKFICGRRMSKPGTPKVLFLYKADVDVAHSSDLKREDTILPSLIPNPNHNMEKIIDQVLVHSAGINSDGSEGCITVDRSVFDAFMTYFSIDDMGIFELIRSPLWTGDSRFNL